MTTLKTEQKLPVTKFTKEELLKGIDDSFNQLNSDHEQSSEIKRKRHNENDPLIYRVADFIDERYELRMDQVRNVLEVNDKSNSDGFVKDEKFEANLIVELLCAGFKGISSTVSIMLASSKYVKQYHPVKHYFENLEAWDGVDRFTEFASCIITTFSDQHALLVKHLRKHLLRCIASVFIPGFFNKHCFVLIGTGQSIGKTTLIRNLLPKQLKPYITDAMLDWKDKDANIALGSNWVINLDELANLNRDETNSLKAILSRDTIKVRRPYDRIDSEIPRLANFFGSTNDLQFLTDLTGNVRWLCFRIAGIDFKYSQINVDQIWAQLYEAFKNGEDYVLSREELQENDKRNEAFMVSNPEMDAIQLYLMPGI